jgi:hypothetical protein
VVTLSGSSVLGEGSISGVDLDRFIIDPNARETIRDDLGVADSAVVLLFVGRLKRENEELDLAEAFAGLHAEFENTALWIVGPDKEMSKTCFICRTLVTG